jgi:hypothetical protein
MSSRFSPVRLVLVTACMLMLPALALAQTSRVSGMAIQGDYIKDYTAIYTWLGSVPNVGNLVYGEMGNLSTISSPATTVPSDRSVGFVIGNLWDGRYGTWALHLRQFTPDLGQGAVSPPSPGVLGSDPNFNANESFDLMWGKKFGTTSLGLRLNKSFASAEGGLGYFNPLLFGTLSKAEFDPVFTLAGALATGAGSANRNLLGFGAGVGFEVNPNTTAEVSLLWQSRTFEIEDSLGNKFEDDGPTAYQINGRAMWQWQPNVLVVPVVKFYKYDLSTRTVGVVPPGGVAPPAGSTTAADNSLKGWQAGAAGNWTLGTNDLFVFGLTFAQNTLEHDTPLAAYPTGFGPFSTGSGKVTETMTPQAFAALESHINNWLTLRFGANKMVFQTTKFEDRATGHTAEVKESPFSMSLGAGVKLGSLQLDGVFNDSFPQTLGGFFSNTADYVSFTRVTVTYPF